MITILFIIFCFYLVAELIKQGTAAKARKREAARQARIEAEMRREREERQRIAAEQKAQREALLAHEKAMRELHLAQLREEKQRLKLEAEQAKQKALMQKQNEQIRKLQQKSEQADIDIGFLLDQYNKYNEIGEYLERERDACVPGSGNWQKWNKKVLTNDAKVHRLNKQLNMAMNTRDEAMIKMREVTA